MNEYEVLLKELRKQEDDIQFKSFTNEAALELGIGLLRAAVARNKSVTIDITRSRQQLFHYVMEGRNIDNDEWIKRKNNVVYRFGHSSYYVGTYLRSLGTTMEEKYLLPSQEYAAHGGAFPLIIGEVGVIGTITVSGLAQEEDHELVVTTLSDYLSGKISGLFT